MAIIDPALGFKPVKAANMFQTFKVDASTAVYRNGPISISAGYAVNSDVTPAALGGVAGIAMHHVDAANTTDTDVIVCIDPDAEYEVNGDIAASLTDIGKYVLLKSVGSSGDMSTATVDITNATVTKTAEMPFIVVGLPLNTTNSATNLKVRVKLVNPQFDYGIPSV